MNRILSTILGTMALFAAACLPAFAQSSTHSPFQQPDYFAVDYGQWKILGQQPNYFLFSPNGVCLASASGAQFFPFATNAPVLIVDAVSANSEVVTPSTVTNASTNCGFTASPANNHTSFQVTSGTGGLQEALNVLAVKGGISTAYPALIKLDRNWFAAASSIPGKTATGILGAVAGNAHAIVQDITTAGATNYVWSGTAYVSGTWTNAVPAFSAGSAAGTGPTISLTGTALAGTISLTTGTSTGTGSLLTVAWATSAQFLYAPTCTWTSVGTNSFTAFTPTSSYGSNAVAGLTATSAPAASTAYKFSYNCH